jgi:hypothetical protein
MNKSKCGRALLHVPVLVASIFNASIHEGKVPPLWKSANVFPILQKNTAQVTDNDLRPISLTPTISKIFEGFVFKWYLNTSYLILIATGESKSVGVRFKQPIGYFIWFRSFVNINTY